MGPSGEAWTTLAEPFRRCLELAWESARNASLGIGAVITDGSGTTVAVGRNRLMEAEAGDDLLAGTPIAHAEMNALAKLHWPDDHGGHVLWTSLQPCALCAGGIRLAGIGCVRYLAADPIWEGGERMGELFPNAKDRWVQPEGPLVGPFGAFAALLPMHASAFWLGALGLPPVWSDRSPDVARLATELAANGELVRLAEAGTSVLDVLDGLWDRLGGSG